MTQGQDSNVFTAPTWEQYKESFPKELLWSAYYLWPWVSPYYRFCAWYSRSSIGGSLRAFEPLGIALAVVTLGFTWAELQEADRDREIARAERQREQALREATLYAMASERLDAARAADKEAKASIPTARKGQIRTLEAMAEIKASISGIDASNTYLAGVNLWGAELRGVDLAGSLLWRANLGHTNLEGASLEGANLGGADLRFANLRYANLRGVELSNTKVAGVNLEGARLEGVRNFSQYRYNITFGTPRSLSDHINPERFVRDK